MTIVRWEPLRELSSLQSEMNRLFNTAFDAPSGSSGPAAAALGAGDGPRRVRRAASSCAPTCPGMSEEDVQIEVEDGTLTVSGERKAEHEQREEGFHRVERSFGAFSRSLTLPKGIDGDAVSARFDRGVLEIRIPKPEAAQAAPHLDRRTAARRPSRAARRRQPPDASRRGAPGP